MFFFNKNTKKIKILV